MYEKLVKSLRICGDSVDAIDECCYEDCVFHERPINPLCMQVLCNKAADAIEELQEDNAALNGTVSNLIGQIAELSKPKWIPVTERCPEEQINPNTQDFEYVLCVTIWGDVRPFKYGTPIGQKDAHFWNGAGYVDAYVTHWMPLPEPPKEETE